MDENHAEKAKQNVSGVFNGLEIKPNSPWQQDVLTGEYIARGVSTGGDFVVGVAMPNGFWRVYMDGPSQGKSWTPTVAQGWVCGTEPVNMTVVACGPNPNYQGDEKNA